MLLGKTRFKFVFIGAGSSTFTLRLVGDILREPVLQEGHLSLVDLDPALLDEVCTAVGNMVGSSGRAFTVSKHTDFREGLDGADFVFLSYATGKYERWKSDIEICTRHGVLQSVGDTIGPGGLIRTLRTIPVAVEIALEMERRCPDVWIINYTNPEGAVCLALQKHTRIRSFGLCHGTPDTAAMLAGKVFGVDLSRFHYRAGGVNHLTWFTEMYVDGVDVYPSLKEKLVASGVQAEEPVSAALLDVFGLYPAPGDRHVEEFFPFFLKERVLAEQDYRWKNNDFVVVDDWRKENRSLFDEVRVGRSGFDAFLKGSGETATHFMRALVTGEPAVEMVNVINHGCIANVADDIIVEVPTYIDRFGLHPQKVDGLPAGIAAKCDALGREYLLSVEAAMTGNFQLALQALYLDPLGAHCDYPERLLRELIDANRDVLPKYWA
jgi:alpha-galactosidase